MKDVLLFCVQLFKACKKNDTNILGDLKNPNYQNINDKAFLTL